MKLLLLIFLILFVLSYTESTGKKNGDYQAPPSFKLMSTNIKKTEEKKPNTMTRPELLQFRIQMRGDLGK